MAPPFDFPWYPGLALRQAVKDTPLFLCGLPHGGDRGVLGVDEGGTEKKEDRGDENGRDEDEVRERDGAAGQRVRAGDSQSPGLRPMSSELRILLSTCLVLERESTGRMKGEEGGEGTDTTDARRTRAN